MPGKISGANLEPSEFGLTFTARQWHQRFSQQAGWTAPIRRHLFERIGLAEGTRVLEVGCGTGAITADLSKTGRFVTFGLDLQRDFLAIAQQVDPRSRYLQADAFFTPFQSACFDAVCCHMFLLWIPDPLAMLTEMRRVTRAGGWILALAEPDYRGRIDFPPPLEQLGRLQADALARQGARANQGRELAGLFSTSGLNQVESGVLGGQWQSATGLDGFEQEWQVLRADLAGWLPSGELERFQEADRIARQQGERVLFVPTFYAIGQV